MTEQTIRNALVYIGVAIVPPVADAVYQALASQMAGGKPIDWGQLGLVTLLALLGAAVASQRPQVGHEAIAAQTNYLQAQGMPKREMVVLHQDEAAPALAGGMTPTQVQQVADELEMRLRATPARTDPGLLSQSPRFLDDAEHPAADRNPVDGTPPLPPPPRGRG